MFKKELAAILETLTYHERDAIHSIIFNGNGQYLPHSNLGKLKDLGLVYQQDSRYYPVGWSYCGGPIGDFFEINMELNAKMATPVR